MIPIPYQDKEAPLIQIDLRKTRSKHNNQWGTSHEAVYLEQNNI